MKSLKNYIVTEGRKQKLANPKAFMKDLNSKYSRSQSEYYKVMTDFLVDDILWKFPEIKFSNLRTKDRKMGYSGIPAEEYTFDYIYKNHVLSFVFNNFFANPFCYIKIDGNDVTHDISGEYGDIQFVEFLSDKNLIDKYKNMIDALTHENTY